MSKNSLRRKKDFDHVFKTGQSFYCQFFALKFIKNNLNINRLGVIIGLKVSKKAVIRNKFKRIFREVFISKWPKNLIGYDIVIIISKKIINEDFKSIENSFIKIINNLHENI